MAAGKVFVCYRSFHPPTGVEYSAYAHLTSPKATNLVTATACLLEIHTIHRHEDQVVSELVLSYTLSGRVEGLNVISLGRPDLPDVLLITLRGAKAVVVCYEPEASELSVLDLYSFSHDAIGAGSAVRAHEPEVVRPTGLGDLSPTVMDTACRCAAMLVYGSQLAVMPFRPAALATKVAKLLRSSIATPASEHGPEGADKDDGMTAVGGLGVEGSTISAAMAFRKKRRRGKDKAAGEGVGDSVLDIGKAKGKVEKEGDPEEEGPEEDEVTDDEEEEEGEGEDGGRGEDEDDGLEFEVELGGEKPYILQLREELGIKGTIRDMRFVNGFMQPTLAVLHECPPTWAGLLSQRAYTCSISIITFGLSPATKATTIFTIDSLPHDCFALLAPPPPKLDGLLVLSSNAVLFVDDGKVQCALGVNGFAPTTVSQPLQPPQLSGLDEALVLTGARGAALSDEAFLLALGSGDLVLLRLHWASSSSSAADKKTASSLLANGVGLGNGSLRGISAKKLGGGQGAGVFATSVSVDRAAGLVLVASGTADSLIMTFELGGKPSDEGTQKGRGGEGMDTSEDDPLDKLTADEDDEEDAFLYGHKRRRVDEEGADEEPEDPEGLRFSLKIVDTLTSLGPLRSGAFGPRLPKEYYDQGMGDGGLIEKLDLEKDEEEDGEGMDGHAGLEPLPPPPFQGTPRDVELLCASGQGKQGGLAVLRRGVVSEVMGRAKLATLQPRGVWVLPSVPEEAEDGLVTADGLSGFIIVALEHKTLVLRYQGQRFVQVAEPEDIGFNGLVPTIGLGAVGGGRGIVQVYGGQEPGLRLVWDGAAANEMMMYDDRDIGGLGLDRDGQQVVKGVSFLDPFILLVLSDGKLLLLAVDGEEGAFVPCDLPWPAAFQHHSSPITAATLFAWYPPEGQAGDVRHTVLDVRDEEDEEAFLYGGGAWTDEDSSSNASRDGQASAAQGHGGLNGEAMDVEDPEGPKTASNGHGQAAVAGGIFCALCRSDGTLEVYAVPAATLVFVTKRCVGGPLLLRNHLLFPDHHRQAHTLASSSTTITEIAVCQAGPLAEPACLFLDRTVLALWTSDDDLLVYAARPIAVLPSPTSSSQPPPLPLSFVKVQHDVVCRTPRHLYDYCDAPPPPSSAAKPLNRLHPFAALGGQRGLFVGGRVPVWILAEKGAVTVQPVTFRQSYVQDDKQKQDQPQQQVEDELCNGFAPFPDADNGFVMLRWQPLLGKGLMDVCSADIGPLLGYTTTTGAVTGAACTVRKVGPLGVEVRCLATVPSRTGLPAYVMVVSKHGRGGAEQEEDVGEDEAVEDPEEEDVKPGGGPGGLEGGGEAEVVGIDELKDFTEAKPEYGGVPPAPGDLECQQETWVMTGAPLEVTQVKSLKRDERGLSLLVYKAPYGRIGYRKTYVVLGTGFQRPKGEDVPATGRMLLYKVEYPTTGKPELKELSSTPHRTGPVGALAQLGAHIILGAGPKVWVYSFMNSESSLTPISFYDTMFYVTGLHVLKSFVLVTDVFKSVQLLQWREPDLIFKGKDYEDCVPYASAFVVDAPSLGIVVCDQRGNVQILQYDRSAVESRAGTKLVRRADFHLGFRVAFLQPCVPRSVPRLPQSGGPSGRVLLAFGTVEGGAGYFIPLEERLFRRLYALQAVMVNALPHPCALNPRGYRLREAEGASFLADRKKTLLDGDLLWRYVGLDKKTQTELAEAVGTDRDAVLDSLQEIDMLTWVV